LRPNESPSVYTPLPATQLMNDAFGGETTINYAAFKHHPWTRDFHNVTVENHASRPGFQAPSIEDAKVVVDSTVTFDRIDKYKPNKIGDLLLSEGFMAQGPATGGPVGSSGEDEEVLVPGLGSGDVSLGLEGQVVSGLQGHLVGRGLPSARESAFSAGPILARASAKGVRIGRMVLLTLVPTSAGRALGKTHGPLKATYVLTFRPHGSHKTYRATRSVQFPARS
jgi:hypothetical protein